MIVLGSLDLNHKEKLITEFGTSSEDIEGGHQLHLVNTSGVTLHYQSLWNPGDCSDLALRSSVAFANTKQTVAIPENSEYFNNSLIVRYHSNMTLGKRDEITSICQGAVEMGHLTAHRTRWPIFLPALQPTRQAGKWPLTSIYYCVSLVLHK